MTADISAAGPASPDDIEAAGMELIDHAVGIGIHLSPVRRDAERVAVIASQLGLRPGVSDAWISPPQPPPGPNRQP